MGAVSEDSTSLVGAALNTLSLTASDTSDAGTIAGYAIVGNAANANSEGVWQYSTDAGSHWHPIGVVGDNATALVLSATTLVRFVPVTN